MANDEFGDRTEQPTDRRRQEAREKGNVARSTDLTGSGLMLAVAAVILMYGGAVARSLAEIMTAHLRGPAWVELNPPVFVEHMRTLAGTLAKTVLPVMLLMALAVLCTNLLQVGFLLSTEAIQPKWSHLNPISGARRILSLQALMKLAVSLGKLLVVTGVAALFVVSALPHLLAFQGGDWALDAVGSSGETERNITFAALLFQEIRSSAGWLGVQIAAALLLLALIDYAFQRWRLEQNLLMTKQEVRDEMKNMEGDPLTRQRRREAHRKLAEARELQAVRHADVVITNPTHIAVALRYKPKEMPAPMVVAKGMGEIAHRIRQIAAEHGVPIIERKPLARALYRDVKVGQLIPLELYGVFVEIMAYVYRLTGKTLDDD